MTQATVRRPASTRIRVRKSPLVRAAKFVGWSLVWLGGLTLGFVVHQLFVTTWFAQQNQAELAGQTQEHFASAEIDTVEWTPVAFDDPTIKLPEGVELPRFRSGAGVEAGELAPTGPRIIQTETQPEPGSSFAVIRIPSIGRLTEGWNVVAGTTTANLRNGAGHMPGTPLPGQPGNSVISGHRTTYGAPFHELDTLEAGDRIEVDTALGTHVYEVRQSVVVEPTDIWVTDPLPGAWLTLTTCHPKFSARERLIVFAELIEGPNAEVILAAS